MLGLLSRKETKSILKTASDDADTLSLAHESKNSIDLPDGESVTTSKLDSREFEFDFELINTAAYRKVFNKARSNLPPDKGSRVHSPPYAPTFSSASAPVNVELPSINAHAVIHPVVASQKSEPFISRPNSSFQDIKSHSVIPKDSTEAAGDGTGEMREEEHGANSENQPDSTSIKSVFRIDEHSVDTTTGTEGKGITSGQSKQLTFIKDYYSEDNIYPCNKVATVWAYLPRASDEFTLEQGDVFQVVGIWNDGWATGYRLNQRAEAYEWGFKIQNSFESCGELKAFPVSYYL